MAGCTDIDYVLAKLAWMRAQGIWPNGQRYLWTDAFGVVLLVSLYERLHEDRYLADAVWIVREVERVLGRARGIRIGEAPDRHGQYFHYLSMWVVALAVLAEHMPEFRRKGIDLVEQIHDAFVVPGHGVHWKMLEDLSAPYPEYGFGALDAFDGYVAYRLLDERCLSRQIGEMRALVEHAAPGLVITQDLGLGMMLWMAHLFPDEHWAVIQKRRCLRMLDGMWQEEGYFCREPHVPSMKFAFTNYGVSLGLQAVGAMSARIERLHAYFEEYRCGDDYDRAAITHVMACTSHFPGRFLRT